MMEHPLFERMAHIDKNVPIPLYYQVKIAIVEAIQDGTLRTGDLLPSENDIAQRISVSRPTIRQALTELVSEGFLDRHQGKGTYVSSPKIENRYFQHLQSFNVEMRQKNLVPTTRILAYELIAGDPVINRELEIPFSDRLIYLYRLRMADNVPMLISESFLPYTQFPGLLEMNLENSSLLECYRDKYKRPIDHVVRQVEAINCSELDAELLQIKHGDAIFLVKSVAYSADNRPIEYSVARYRGDRSKFSVEMFADNHWNKDKARSNE